jgi:hypothetical protein
VWEQLGFDAPARRCRPGARVEIAVERDGGSERIIREAVLGEQLDELTVFRCNKWLHPIVWGRGTVLRLQS